LTLNILGAIAQFERQIMLTRQIEGIKRAKSQGKYRGRAPTGAKVAETAIPPLSFQSSPDPLNEVQVLALGSSLFPV
jgi:DNA invertase Pin-like site-specific DNA recombinase